MTSPSAPSTDCSNISLLWSLILPAFHGGLNFLWFTPNASVTTLPDVQWESWHNKQHRRNDPSGKPWQQWWKGNAGYSNFHKGLSQFFKTEIFKKAETYKKKGEKTKQKKTPKQTKNAPTTVKDFKKIFHRKLSRKTSFTLEKEILFCFCIPDTEC